MTVDLPECLVPDPSYESLHVFPKKCLQSKRYEPVRFEARGGLMLTAGGQAERPLLRGIYRVIGTSLTTVFDV